MLACFTTPPHSYLYLGEAFLRLPHLQTVPASFLASLWWWSDSDELMDTERSWPALWGSLSWSVQPEIKLSIRTGGWISHEECLHFSSEADPRGHRRMSLGGGQRMMWVCWGPPSSSWWTTLARRSWLLMWELFSVSHLSWWTLSC